MVHKNKEKKILHLDCLILSQINFLKRLIPLYFGSIYALILKYTYSAKSNVYPVYQVQRGNSTEVMYVTVTENTQVLPGTLMLLVK